MQILQDQVPIGRLLWFTDLRWWAAGVGLFILFTAPMVAPVTYEPVRLASVLVLLGLLNGLYRFVWRRVSEKGADRAHLARAARVHIHVQMLGDLALLTFLLVWSGGLENPLFLIYLFHLAIGSMTLPRAQSLFYAGLTTLLPWGLWGLEGLGKVKPLWGGTFLLGGDYQQALLMAYTAAGWGLWFFLTNLTGDLLDKETALRETGNRLQAANEDLKRLDEQKNQLFRQIAHDLKNPLAAASSCLDAAEITLPKRKGKAGEMLGRAKARLGGLAELVDDLTWLSQSKSPNPPYQREKLNPTLLAQRAVQEVEEKARRKGIKVKLVGPVKTRFSADPWAFQRVLSNLLDNAVKYTPPKGGEIRLVIEKRDGGLNVTVSDSGVGVPVEEQALLFQEFMRASNVRSLGEPGTGLGLVIVKRIMEWHGGKVQLISRPGEGTRVETWWPSVETNESGSGTE